MLWVRCVALLSVTFGLVGQLWPNKTREQVISGDKALCKKGNYLEESVPSLRKGTE